MSRKKLVRFARIEKMENVVEPSKDLYKQIKGQWATLVFDNSNPITLELGCGKGEYALGLARQFPERNFVGVDIKGERIWKGAAQAESEGLPNVAFLRTEIELLADFFTAGEVAEIWLTFPDPRPKNSEVKKRLTSPRFVRLYRQILSLGGLVHLKTDSGSLFDYSLKVWGAFESPLQDLVFTEDLYGSPLLTEHFDLQTTFEQKFLAQGLPIYYLRGRLT